MNEIPWFREPQFWAWMLVVGLTILCVGGALWENRTRDIRRMLDDDNES